MTKKSTIILILLIGLLSLTPPASAQNAVVRAVLFFSPTCPHCHQVMDYDLPPLQEKYGAQLDILMVDVTNESGYNLYIAAVEALRISRERFGVPTLIVGDTVLVGSMEIPQLFPSIIERGLQSGGIAWPEIPGLEAVLIAQNKELTPPQSSEQTNTLPIFMQKFLQDPTANTIALIVLMAMLISVGLILRLYLAGKTSARLNWPGWLIPLLSLFGAAIAFYLTYVETTQQEAICGPVGDCNAVQNSPFAMLFGFLPVGLLGLIGYASIFAAWLVSRKAPAPWRGYAQISIWGMSWFGVLFSIYLTFLEPFVIGATCMWCVTSAIVMTVLLYASTNSALEAMGINAEEPEDEVEEEGANQKT